MNIFWIKLKRIQILLG